MAALLHPQNGQSLRLGHAGGGVGSPHKHHIAGHARANRRAGGGDTKQCLKHTDDGDQRIISCFGIGNDGRGQDGAGTSYGAVDRTRDRGNAIKNAADTGLSRRIIVVDGQRGPGGIRECS